MGDLRVRCLDAVTTPLTVRMCICSPVLRVVATTIGAWTLVFELKIVLDRRPLNLPQNMTICLIVFRKTFHARARNRIWFTSAIIPTGKDTRLSVFQRQTQTFSVSMLMIIVVHVKEDKESLGGIWPFSKMITGRFPIQKNLSIYTYISCYITDSYT